MIVPRTHAELQPAARLEDAFRPALLRMELSRAIVMVFLLASLGLLIAARRMVFGPAAAPAPVPWNPVMVAGLLGAVIYETFVISRVVRAMERRAHLGAGVIVVSIIVENSIPTLAIIGLTEGVAVGPYHALGAPVLLTYPMFILLSATRIRPSLPILAGVVAAAGNAGVLIYTLLRFGEPADRSYGFTIMYPIMLLGIGVAAAFVAWRLRWYVRTGLETGARAERIEGDLETARDVQRALLPAHAPYTPGLEVAGSSEPADETGGDFYDWARLEDGTLLVTIGDVAGHGIAPALVTAACRAYVRACITSGAGLAAGLSRISELISADLPSNRFITLALIAIEQDDHRVRLLSAGHGPLLHYHASTGTVERIRADAVPLGIEPRITFNEPAPRALEAGDALVVVTDGVYEYARADGAEFGVDRLCDAIIDAADRPAEEMITSMWAAIAAFAGDAPQIDDLTAIVIRRPA